MTRPPFVVRSASAGRTAILAMTLVVGGCNGGRASLVPPTPATTPTQPVAIDTATPLESLPPQPPDAFMAVEPMPGVKGALGTYTWLQTGSDAPWLPGAAVALPAGRVARIVLNPADGLIGWRVRTGGVDGSGTKLLASGAAPPIEFPVPAAPTTIQLELDYGTTGSVTWYWAVTPAP